MHPPGSVFFLARQRDSRVVQGWMHSEDRRPTVLHWNWEDCQIRRPFVLVSRSWLDDGGGIAGIRGHGRLHMLTIYVPASQSVRRRPGQAWPSMLGLDWRWHGWPLYVLCPSAYLQRAGPADAQFIRSGCRSHGTANIRRRKHGLKSESRPVVPEAPPPHRTPSDSVRPIGTQPCCRLCYTGPRFHDPSPDV